MQLTQVCAKGHHTLIFNISERKTDDYVSTNKTILDWSIQLKTNSGWAYNTVGSTLKLKFGNDIIFEEYKQRSASVGIVTWASGSKEIEHNSDGSKTINFECSYNQSSTSSWTPGNATITGSINLTTIPRKSSVTATNAEIEDVTKIEIKRASNSFTHTLKYSFEGLTETIATKTSNTSISWTIPTTFYAKIPNDKKGTCTITCETYSGNTLIGSSACTFEASCSETKCKPTVSATVVDTNQLTVNLTGSNTKIVKYKSNAKISASVTPKNSATISNIFIEGLSQPITISNGNATANRTINNVDKNNFIIKAKDSRGFPTSDNDNKIITIAEADFINYVQLTCSYKVKRASQVSSKVKLTGSGNYYNGSFGTTNNTLSLSFSYKEKGTDSWISGGIITPTISNNTYAFEVEAPTDFDYKKAYEFIVYYSDKLDTLSITKNLKKGIASLAVHEKGIKANDEVLVRWDNDDGKLKIGAGLLNAIYPINSQFITSTNENPSNIFGGTWELIDKEFEPKPGTKSGFTPNTAYISTNDFYFGRNGHTLNIEFYFKLNGALNDNTITLGTLDFSTLGITRLTNSIKVTGYSDGGDAVIMIYIGVNGTVESVDVVGTDIIPANETVHFSASESIHYSQMLDSACNKFYWKRVS